MGIYFNICHNFRIGHFDQSSTIFKLKIYFSLGLEFDGTWTEILFNLTQIQDYTMSNMWLHEFDGGILHPRAPKWLSASSAVSEFSLKLN
jgi:hypothetical protein